MDKIYTPIIIKYVWRLNISRFIYLVSILFAIIVLIINAIVTVNQKYQIQNLQEQQIQNELQKTIKYKVTAYCPCEKCCGKSDGITASGYKIRKGNKFCASPLPFCTILDIPGYGVAPVLDRGGAIKENCIDIYFDTHQEALAWGIQYLEIRILK